MDVRLARRRDTIRLGKRLASKLGPGDMMILTGELGAGKTFLTRAIARAFEIPTDIAIASPTFTLVQEYEIKGGVFLHADLYRLRDEDRVKTSRDISRLGLAERRAEGAILVVEWGETYEAELGGDPTYVVKLTMMPGGSERIATITGTGVSRL